MTTQQEDKIVKQAQDILERRLGVQDGLKVNLRNIMYYGAYLLGAQLAVRKVTDYLIKEKPKGDDWIYLQAEWDLITKDKRSMQLFLDGTEMRYRNHKTNKKGKLESVECYFVEYRNVITEVK